MFWPYLGKILQHQELPMQYQTLHCSNTQMDPETIIILLFLSETEQHIVLHLMQIFLHDASLQQMYSS